MLGRIDTVNNWLDKFITHPYGVAIASPIVCLVSSFALSFFCRGFVLTKKDDLGRDNFKNGVISLVSPFVAILPGLLVIKYYPRDNKLTKIVLLVSTVSIFIGSYFGTFVGHETDAHQYSNSKKRFR